MRPLLLLLPAVASLLVACSDADQELQCRVGADCASGVCLSNGTCQTVVPEPDAGPDTPLEDAQDAAEDPGDLPDSSEADSTSTTCSPNKDGIITREEVPLKAGLNAKFKVATSVAVDTTGTDQGGKRLWDYSGDLTGDHLTLVELQKLDSLWFAPDYPTATYAARLSDSQDLLGVFQLTDSQLLLLGVVSPEDGLYRTQLKYEPAVVVLQFPLQPGATWTTTSQVSGVAMGVMSVYTEKYESQVDAQGELKIPLGTFEVLRVRTLLTRTVVPIVTTTRTFTFTSECFGTIASITSESNETKEEFTKASEIRRLSP